MTTCATCKFHEGTECHRYPPTPIPVVYQDNNWDGDFGIDYKIVSEWPDVGDDDWCGEYLQKAEEHGRE